MLTKNFIAIRLATSNYNVQTKIKLNFIQFSTTKQCAPVLIALTTFQANEDKPQHEK